MLSMLAQPEWTRLDTLPVAARSDAWEDLVSTSYTDVTLTQQLLPGFEGSIRRRALSGLSIAECDCDPHAGVRSATLVRDEREPCIGLQIVLGGAETFQLGDTEVPLSAGSAVIWSSRQPFTYKVQQRLHKVTLVIPFEQFGTRVRPELLEHGRVLQCSQGAEALLFTVTAALRREFTAPDASGNSAIRRAVIELLVAALAQPIDTATPRSRSERHLVRVQEYITNHLADAELRLCDIAADTGISLRYLHLLFERSGTSVSAWILNARLERCREALRDADHAARSITDIAFEWGFNNTAYFSRAFRRRFGEPPSACRRPGGNGLV